ncbi:hypothetical protein JW859_03740 [bacterium]|nr:hypothetical protein [bacterium]
MTITGKLKTVLRHVFSKKTIGYILLSLLWTMIAVMFWNYTATGKLVLFESLEITLTIMGGKLILYGIWDWVHLGHKPTPETGARVVTIVTNGDADDRFGEYCIL